LRPFHRTVGVQISTKTKCTAVKPNLTLPEDKGHYSALPGTLPPLNPTVPLAPRTVASLGQEQIHRSPLSLNAPSTAPESPLSRAWNIPPCSAAAARPHYLALNPQRPAPSRNSLPVHRPLPLSPAFKRSPQHCKKIRTTTLYLPDIITQSLSLSVAQELDAGAPRTRRSAAVPDHLLRRRLPGTADTNHRRRPAPSPPLTAAAGELPKPRRLPGSLSLPPPSRWGRRILAVGSRSNPTARDPPYPLRVLVKLTDGPRSSAHFFLSLHRGRANGPA
jgi:hypothetical protein